MSEQTKNRETPVETSLDKSHADGVENVISDDFFNSEKRLLKGGESRNQAVLPIFVGYALCAWGILTRCLTCTVISHICMSFIKG